MAIDWSRGPKRYLAVGAVSLALLMGATGAASAEPQDSHPGDRPGHERNEHKRGHDRR